MVGVEEVVLGEENAVVSLSSKSGSVSNAKLVVLDVEGGG
jgi:hypothetical protein